VAVSSVGADLSCMMLLGWKLEASVDLELAADCSSIMASSSGGSSRRRTFSDGLRIENGTDNEDCVDISPLRHCCLYGLDRVC
jgi:hypothetical protein